MLFNIINNVLVVNDHVLMIEPYSTIWEADDDPNKLRARKLFKYVELVCSPRKSNPYFGYSEEERPARVKKEIFKDENYPDTEFMIQAIVKYKELLENYSPTYSLLSAGLNSKEKLTGFLNDFDPDERTRTGVLVLKPKEITSALKELPDVAKGIEIMRNKVNFEIEEGVRTRNQREIGQYEQ